MKSTTVARNCQVCAAPFNAPIKEVKRGNARYCSLSCAATGNNRFRQANQKFEHLCEHCGSGFNSMISTAKYCSTHCKQKGTYRKRHRGESIPSFLYKLPCAICGWSDTVRDVHHIVALANGGADAVTNLITLCPNHHRMADRNLISQDKLFELVKLRTMSSTDGNQLSGALAGD